MKFDVKLTENALEEFNSLQKPDRNKVLKAFDIIMNVDIKAVTTKPLTSKIYEIKTDKIRCLYAYSDNKIIIVGVIFIKKTQKTPKTMIAKAENICCGKRASAGRKPKNPNNVLVFQMKVSDSEREFLYYAREHNINYKDLMQG